MKLFRFQIVPPLFVLLVACQVGCSSIIGDVFKGPERKVVSVRLTPEIEQFTKLESRSTDSRAERPQEPVLLVVSQALGDSWLDSRNIFYSPASGEVSYYRYTNWVSSPLSQLRGLITEVLADPQTGLLVLEGSSAARASYILDWRLVELVHDTTETPGVSRIAVRAELTKLPKRTLISARLFRAQTQCSLYSARGAVDGFNLAAQGVLAELREWVVASVQVDFNANNL